MVKLRYISSAVFVFLLFSTQAFAKIITDVEAVNSRVGYAFERGNSVSWTHDLSDQSFFPVTASSATLTVEFSDDYDQRQTLVRRILGQLIFPQPLTGQARRLSVTLPSESVASRRDVCHTPRREAACGPPLRFRAPYG